MYMNFETKFIP